MTPEHFCSLVNEDVSIGFPFRAWGMRLKADYMDGPAGPSVRVTLCCDAPHRDTGVAGRGAVTFVHTLHAQFVRALGQDAAAEYVRSMLRELVLHELDESLHLKGVRAFDPHKAAT